MMQNIIAYSITIILIYYFSYFGARILSKKAMSEMTAYEMVGVIILGTVAAEPLVKKVMTEALYGTGLLILLIFVTAKIAVRNKATRFFEHTPTVLVQDGKIKYDALKSSNLSLNMFYGLLRTKGYSKTEDLEYVILEPQGKLSTFPKSQKRPVQPSDMNIPTKYEGIAIPLIFDGKIIKDGLIFVKLTENWLKEELRKQSINDLSTVLLAELDSSGTVYITKK